MEDSMNFIDDVEIVKEFLVESNDHLDDVESKILELEKIPKMWISLTAYSAQFTA